MTPPTTGTLRMKEGTMDELREKIAEQIGFEIVGAKAWAQSSDAFKAKYRARADRILAIPEIADGIVWSTTKATDPRCPHCGKSPLTSNLGHSITVHRD